MERGQLAWLRNEKSRPANPKAHRTPPDDLRRPTRSVRLCGRSGYSHRRVSKRPPTSSGRVWRGLRISGSGPRRFSTPAARGRPPRCRRRANLRSPRGYHDPRALARLGRGTLLHLRGCGDSTRGSGKERMERAARGRSNLLTSQAVVVLQGGPFARLLEPFVAHQLKRMGPRTLAAFKYLVEHGEPPKVRHAKLPRVATAC